MGSHWSFEATKAHDLIYILENSPWLSMEKGGSRK
jgi:hypothetical protein